MIKEFYKFVVAVNGIFHAIREEKHMRFHLVACFYVFLFGNLFRLNSFQWCVIAVTVSLVIVSEMINTAVENLCDLYTKSYNDKIKVIKDIASGGVLISAVFSLLIGFFIFGNLDKIKFVLGFYLSSPLAVASLIVTAVISIVFIHLPKKEKV